MIPNGPHALKIEIPSWMEMTGDIRSIVEYLHSEIRRSVGEWLSRLDAPEPQYMISPNGDAVPSHVPGYSLNDLKVDRLVLNKLIHPDRVGRSYHIDVIVDDSGMLFEDAVRQLLNGMVRQRYEMNRHEVRHDGRQYGRSLIPNIRMERRVTERMQDGLRQAMSDVMIYGTGVSRIRQNDRRPEMSSHIRDHTLRDTRTERDIHSESDTQTL